MDKLDTRELEGYITYLNLSGKKSHFKNLPYRFVERE